MVVYSADGIIILPRWINLTQSYYFKNDMSKEISTGNTLNHPALQYPGAQAPGGDKPVGAGKNCFNLIKPGETFSPTPVYH
jgi:hypothetical protein